jgi:hypothetical protein
MKRPGSWFVVIAVGIALCILRLHSVRANPDENTDRFASSEPGDKPLPAFHAELLNIAREYRSWRPLDTASRWAPTLCRAPLPSDLRNVELRLSASGDADTHGQKLYLLYARDPAAYRRAPNHPAAVGQVIVKEAWKPVRVTEADKTAEGWKAIRQTLTDRGYPTSCTVEVKGQSLTVPVRFLATKGDVQYRPGGLDSLFIMFKTDETRDGTDNGWVYGTVIADGMQVTAAGRIDQCMACHREAGQDRLFGVKTIGFTQVPGEQTSDAVDK